VSRKPNPARPVPPQHSPCGPCAGGVRRDDHSSSAAIAGGIKRPTRRLYRRAVCCGLRRGPPYLVLLRAGFCLPLVLPRARCALTAPFHPYPFDAALSRLAQGGMFSVPLSFGLPRPGVTRRTALRSSDFPPAFAREAREGGRSSVPLRRFKQCSMINVQCSMPE